MAFRRRFNRFRKRFKRRGQSYGPPLRRTRWNRRKRVSQNLTRECRWFKTISELDTVTPNGFLRLSVDPQTMLQDTIQFTKFGSIWEEYKVLKIIMRLYPAHLGSESVVDNTNIAGTWGPRFYRGNLVTWVDPQGDSSNVTNVISVMGKPSAKIANPRNFVKRWLDRPRSGYPTWGTIDPDGQIIIHDKWNGQIRVFGEGFTPPAEANTALHVYYYAEMLFKVLFRSRQDA